MSTSNDDVTIVNPLGDHFDQLMLSSESIVHVAVGQQKYYTYHGQIHLGSISISEFFVVLLASGWAFVIIVRLALAACGEWGAEFGTALGRTPSQRAAAASSSGLAPIQVGYNPHTGRRIYELQYLHWCLKPCWQYVANCIQLLIFSFFILSVSLDSWSIKDGYMFGVVSYHGTRNRPGDSYANFCSLNGQTSDQQAACNTLRATGAIILIWTILGAGFMLSLLIQILLSACQPQSTQWYPWQYKFAVFQSQQLWWIFMLWFFGGYMNLGGFKTDAVSLGISWWITFACWILSIFLIFFYRAAIQYRLNGEPVPPTDGGVFVAGGVRIQSPSLVEQHQHWLQQQFPLGANIEMESSYPQSQSRPSPQVEISMPSLQPRAPVEYSNREDSNNLPSSSL